MNIFVKIGFALFVWFLFCGFVACAGNDKFFKVMITFATVLLPLSIAFLFYGLIH